MRFEPGTKTEDGYLALPETGLRGASTDGSAGPGVLVLHAWWGLNDFFTGLCDRLACEGFVALAPDLYGGVVASTIEEAQEIQKRAEGQADREAATQEKVLAAVDALKIHSAVTGETVGLVGCSMGVWWGLKACELRPDAVSAAVMFYGAGEADFSIARAAYQIHFAENDTWEDLDYTRQVVSEMQTAGRSVDLFVYPNTGHWFFEADRPDAYDADAAALAWERTVSFLNAALKTA